MHREEPSGPEAVVWSPLSLVRDLTSSDPKVRWDASEAVTDVLGDLTAHDAAMLANVLVSARLVEDDEDCQESQLNALGSLKERDSIPSETLAPLRYLSPATVRGSQTEHLAWLLDEM